MRKISGLAFLTLSVFLNFVGTAFVSTAHASPPQAPTFHLTVSNNRLELSWSASSDASGYRLYYADYPDAATVNQIDMGTATNIAVDLPADFALYLAVQAYNSDGDSDISNIEFFDTSNPDSPSVVSVFPADSSDGIEADINLIVNFNKAMDSAEIVTLSSGLFTLRATYLNATVNGSILASSDGKSFTFDPDQALEEGKEYQAVISARAKDSLGNLVSETVSWQFYVGDLPLADFALPFDITDVMDSTLSPFGAIRRASDTTIGHGGIDIPLPEGAPFYAVADSVIISVEVGSGDRGGTDVTLLLRTDGNTDSGWYFEYEHITLEPGIAVGSVLTRNQLFARNPGTAANNHLEFGYWNGTFTFSKSCWIDFLDSTDFADTFSSNIRTSADFIRAWTTIQEEGVFPLKGFLDTDNFPNGAQLCYELRTDVRIAAN